MLRRLVWYRDMTRENYFEERDHQKKFFLDDFNVKFASFARRGGKTQSTILEAVYTSARSNKRSVILVPFNNQVDEIKSRLTSLLRTMNINFQLVGNILQIHNAGCIEIYSSHNSENNMRGKTIDRLIIDEAQYVTNIDSIFNMAMFFGIPISIISGSANFNEKLISEIEGIKVRNHHFSHIDRTDLSWFRDNMESEQYEIEILAR